LALIARLRARDFVYGRRVSVNVSGPIDKEAGCPSLDSALKITHPVILFNQTFTSLIDFNQPSAYLS
jgi:hypothetical protein